MGTTGYTLVPFSNQSSCALGSSAMYPLTHTINLTVFFALLCNARISRMSQLGTLYKKRRMSAYSTATILSIMAAMPPFSGFTVKIDYLHKITSCSTHFESLYLVLCPIPSFYHHIRMVKYVFLPDSSKLKYIHASRLRRIPFDVSYVIALLPAANIISRSSDDEHFTNTQLIFFDYSHSLY
jgi:NADH:ubiquinone oxidoreductase subunit 2 (subunit N)